MLSKIIKLNLNKNQKCAVFAILSLLIGLMAQFVLYSTQYGFGHFINTLNFYLINPDVTFGIGLFLLLLAVIIFVKSFKNRDFIDDSVLQVPFTEKETITRPKVLLCGLFLFLALVVVLILFYLIIMKNSYMPIYNILWFLSLVFGGLAVYFYDSRLPDLSFLKPNKQDLFLIFMLITFFLCTALPYLEVMPYKIETDEGNMGLHIDKFKHDVVNMFGFSDFYGVPNLSFYLIYLFTMPFEIDVLGIRYSIIILAIITIPIFYLGVKTIFNKDIAAISSILLVASHLFINHTRTGYHHFQSIFLISLFILVFISALKTNNKLLMYLTGVIVGFGFYLYFSCRILIPVLMLFFAYLFILFWHKRLTIFNWLLCMIVGFALMFYPMLFESFKHPFDLNQRANSVLILNGEGFDHTSYNYNSQNKPLVWSLSFKDALLGYFATAGKGSTYMVNRPFMDFYSSIFLIFGLVLIMFKLKDYRYFFIASTFWLITIIGGALTVDALCFQRVLINVPITAIICGLSLFSFAKSVEALFIKDLYKKLFTRIFLILSILIVIAFNYEVFFYSYIINCSSNSIYDSNTMAAYMVKRANNKYKLFIVKSIYSHPEGYCDHGIDFSQPAAQFILKETILYNELYINNGSLPIKYTIDKDVIFIITADMYYKNLNILLKYYRGGKIYAQNNQENSLVFLIYVVPKEIINKQVSTGML